MLDVGVNSRTCWDSAVSPIIEGKSHQQREQGAKKRLNELFRAKNRFNEWDQLLRQHGKFGCYALYLLLPTDEEAKSYLLEYGKELNLISGNNTLIIALSDSQIIRIGFDERLWKISMREHISEGHSIRVGKLFDISFDEYPCLVVFNDIREPDHVLIELKGMSAAEIANNMRTIFSIIQDAIQNNKNPLDAIKSYKFIEKIKIKVRSAASGLANLTDKTFEAAISAWIKSIVG